MCSLSFRVEHAGSHPTLNSGVKGTIRVLAMRYVKATPPCYQVFYLGSWPDDISESTYYRYFAHAVFYTPLNSVMILQQRCLFPYSGLPVASQWPPQWPPSGLPSGLPFFLHYFIHSYRKKNESCVLLFLLCENVQIHHK